MDGPPDVATIVANLQSDQDRPRKLAAYSLQGLLADPSFADAFVQADGIPVLKQVILDEHGNTLAYALGSLNRILQLNMGWDEIGSSVIALVSTAGNLR